MQYLLHSVFHYGEFSIRQVKEYLKSRGVEVRLSNFPVFS